MSRARAEIRLMVVGETVLGRFTLVARLGAGGFGTVYSAWDERLQRRVAVKVIEARGDAGRRVLREAQAAARLNHRGIVTLYEMGEDGRRAYLVSELAAGETLDALAGAGRISDRAVARIGAELCDALAHAHDNGVVHRDIKPQNVVVRPADRPLPAGAPRAKLMDFGIAHLHDGAKLTRTGEVVGTIAYMAPEQAEGEPATPAVDAYALALTLYECWTGGNPVSRATPAATARAIGEPVPPLATARRDLPPGLCEVVDACLEGDPEERPDVAELGRELGAAMRRLSGSRPVPAARRLPLTAPAARMRLARIGAIAMIFAAIAWLALAAGRPGAALVVALLVVPIPLLLDRPVHWTLPVLAPLLGALGIAPLYPALAALAPTARRRFALGSLGFAWLAVAEALFGRSLLFGTVAAAPVGWTTSLSAAGELIGSLLAPDVVLGGLVWGAAAAVLGYLLRGRMVALELLGVLVWAAGLVAVHRLLAPTAEAPAAAPLAVGAAAVALVVLWLRTAERPIQTGSPPSGLA
jgi:eukaryotic-like serine/threonine-protein kinase